MVFFSLISVIGAEVAKIVASFLTRFFLVILYICLHNTLFFAVITNDLAQILGTASMVDISCIDVGGKIGTGAFLSLVLVVFLFLFFPIFFIGKLTILEPQKMGRLVRGFVLVKGLISKILSSKSLELGRSNVKKTVFL